MSGRRVVAVEVWVRFFLLRTWCRIEVSRRLVQRNATTAPQYQASCCGDLKLAGDVEVNYNAMFLQHNSVPLHHLNTFTRTTPNVKKYLRSERYEYSLSKVYLGYQ